MRTGNASREKNSSLAWPPSLARVRVRVRVREFYSLTSCRIYGFDVIHEKCDLFIRN